MINIKKSDFTLKYNSKYKKKLLKYLYQCILSEGSKIIIFSIISLKLNIFPEFLVALFMLMLLRTNGGGIHCKHYASCFILSFAMLFGCIFLANLISLPILYMRIITLFCIPVGYFSVPITSTNRPAASNSLIRKCKRNTLLILSAFFILICISPNNLYYRIGFWTIIMHIIQLLVALILMKGGKMNA